MSGQDIVADGGRRLSLPRRIGLAVIALLLALVLFVGIKIAPLLLEPNRYAGVRSIERSATYRDAALMRAAWALPVATTYRQTPYVYQPNQSFCGPTSLANVFHSLGRTATPASVIDGTRYEPWFGVLLGGLTLDQLADLLQSRLGQSVTVVRDPTLTQFRAHLARANDPAWRYVVNFHRGPLFGRGHGHFSPILGYLPDRDLVLVGDVNASYQPFLVGSERLWRAMNTRDEATGKDRGLLVVAVR